MKRILILGISGMLGHVVFTKLFNEEGYDVFATSRNNDGLTQWFPEEHFKNIKSGIDADNFDSIVRVMTEVQPDVVINCIGLIKQLPSANDPISAISINALFPHRVAKACMAVGARMIHISTDCVFSGEKGNYSEDDPSDATDLYGRTKFLGEVSYPHCVTLRTSIIGHELKGKFGLIEWFLSQKDKVRGYTNAIYTGFPTIEIARIIAEYVIPNQDLSGVYQVSSAPINKYELLRLVAQKYGKSVEIEPYGDFFCDRSLNSSRFQKNAGYSPPSWIELIDAMYRDFSSAPHYQDKRR